MIFPNKIPFGRIADVYLRSVKMQINCLRFRFANVCIMAVQKKLISVPRVTFEGFILSLLNQLIHYLKISNFIYISKDINTMNSTVDYCYSTYVFI